MSIQDDVPAEEFDLPTHESIGPPAAPVSPDLPASAEGAGEVRRSFSEGEKVGPTPVAAAPVSPDVKVAPTPADQKGGAAAARRPLMLAVVGIALIGVIALVALLMSRSAPSSNVAAAPAAAANAVKPAGSSTAPKAGQPPAAKWSSENRAVWVGKRKDAAAFEVSADNMVPVWMKQVRPMLVVRCIANGIDVFVFTGTAMQMEANTEDHTVRYSFDDDPQRTERWPDGAEHDALFAPDGAAFAARLSRARMLHFGYTPHNAGPVTAHFQVAGLPELLASVAKQCGPKK